MPETRRHGHGQVALEWHGDSSRRFSVVIGPEGMLIYAARLGSRGRLDGAEPIGKDFTGSSISVPVGADGVPGLAEALKGHTQEVKK